MAFQGKCDHCKVKWQWKKREFLRYMRCPQCGRALKRTSSLMQDYPERDISEAIDALKTKKSELEKLNKVSVSTDTATGKREK